MFHSNAKQKGMTFGGLVFVLAFIAILVLFTLRAFPLYNEKMSVISSMKSVVSKPHAATMSVADIRKSFLRNIEATTNIELFNDQTVKDHVDVVNPKKSGEPRMLRVHYTAKNKLFQDLSLLMEFDQSMPLGGNGGGSE